MAVIINTFVILVMLQLMPFISEANPLSGQKLRLSQSCTRRGYCFEKHKDYPQDIVDSILKKKNISMKNTKISLNTLKQEDDGNDCEKKTQSDPIYELVDQNNVTRVVVQSRDYFIQTFQVEECLRPGRMTHASRHFQEDLVQEQNLHCVEQSMAFRLLVLSRDWSDAEFVDRDLPVACYCVVIPTLFND